jgi:hypothetical protein
LILAVFQWETFDNFPRMRIVPGAVRQRKCQAAHKTWTDCGLPLRSGHPHIRVTAIWTLNEGLR